MKLCWEGKVEQATQRNMSDKIKAASEHDIDLANKTEPEPLIRKSTINDSARHSPQCYCSRTTRGLKWTEANTPDANDF